MDDLEDLVKNLNNEEIVKNLAMVPWPYTKPCGEWFINYCC